MISAKDLILNMLRAVGRELSQHSEFSRETQAKYCDDGFYFVQAADTQLG